VEGLIGMFEKDRRERRRADRAFDEGVGVTRYQMRQKMVSFGDDYWIDDEAGHRQFKVDGKVLRARRTFHIEDPDGHRVAVVRGRPLRIKDSMSIEDADGNRIALVKKAIIGPMRDRWRIEQNQGSDLTVHGNFVDHEYAIENDGRKVAEVSKKWFRVRDTYGLEIGSGVDHATVLAAAIAIDAMTHPGD
jgi:uncharacterized protein YxjI